MIACPSFLPLSNDLQVMQAQVQYLDFKNGQGPVPINNAGLIYTFQGLTSDGNYYIAAVLPVTHPDLPDTQQVSGKQIDEEEGFRATLAKAVAWLDEQPSGSFSPELEKLDGMIESMEVE